MESEHQMYILMNKKGKHTTISLMLETSFLWMSKSKQRLFKHSFSKLDEYHLGIILAQECRQSMTNHLGMEGSEFIGRKRELGIQKRGQKVHISRGNIMMIRLRGPNGRYQHINNNIIIHQQFQIIMIYHVQQQQLQQLHLVIIMMFL